MVSFKKRKLHRNFYEIARQETEFPWKQLSTFWKKKQSSKYFKQSSIFLTTGNVFTPDRKKLDALDSDMQEIKWGRAIFFFQQQGSKPECEVIRDWLRQGNMWKTYKNHITYILV